MKKCLSLFLMLAVLMSSMPLYAFAEDGAADGAVAAAAESTETAGDTAEEAKPAAKEAEPEKKSEPAPATEPEKKSEPAPVTEPEKKSEPAPVSEPAPSEQTETAGASGSESADTKTEETAGASGSESADTKTEETAGASGSESADTKTEETASTSGSEPADTKTEEASGAPGSEPADAKTEETADTSGSDSGDAKTDETTGAADSDTADAENGGNAGTESGDSSDVEGGVTAGAGTDETAGGILDIPMQTEDGKAFDAPSSVWTLPVPLDEDGDDVSPITSLDKPTGLSASTVTSTSVKLQWYAVDNAEGYEVQSSTSSSFTAATTTEYETDKTSYTVKDLNCGETRYYRVRAFAASETEGEKIRSAWSNPVTFRTSPAAPTTLTATALTATSAQLTWGKVSGATGYIVMQDGTQILKTTNNTTLTCKSTGLTMGVEYTYRVYSYKTVNGEAVQSESYVECKYKAAPPAPKNVKTKSAGLSQITISWDAVADASGYYLYRALATTEKYEKWATLSGADATSYTDATDIVTGETYEYYVTAFADSVEGEKSSTVTGRALPGTPANIKAAYIDSSSIRITWDAVSGARGYILEVSDSKNGDYEVLSTDSVTSFTHTGLTLGQVYYYRVRAYVRTYDPTNFTHVESANSLVVSEMPRPEAPSDLELTNVRYDQIKVSYTRPEGADGYQVYRSTDGQSWTLIRTYDSTYESSYTTSKDLTCGKTYYYRVRAFIYGSDGTTRYPGPYTEAKSLQAVPPAPETITVARVSGKNQYKVSWSAVPYVDGYRVCLKTNGGGGELVKSVSSTSLSATISGLKPGYTYQVFVRPYRNVNGTRVDGERKYGDTEVFPFDKPTNLKRTTIDMTSFKLGWDAIGGVDGYRVFVTGKDDPSFEKTLDVTTNSATIDGLVSGYDYTCTVKAYTIVNDDRVYGPVSDEYISFATPVKPTGFTSRTLYDSVGAYLSWNAVEGADGYIILRSTNSSSGFEQIAKLEGSEITNYSDRTDTEVGTKYYYRLYSYIDKAGVRKSTYTTTNTTALLPRPTLTLSNSGTSKVILDWTEVESADGYAIYRSTSASGTYSQIGTVSASKTTYTASSLTCGTTYYFRVRAYYINSSGTRVYGTQSKAQSITPSPVAPSGLKGTPYAQSVKLSWSKLSGASGYRVYRATGTGSYVAVADVTGTSYTNTGLVCEQRYRYKVAAYVNVNGKKVVGPAGDYITVDTAVTKTTGVKYSTVSPTSTKLTWTSVRDADGYVIQRKTAGGEYTTVATVKTNTCTIGDMKVGQYCNFRIKAYVDQGGERIYCDSWSDEKKVCTIPSAATKLASPSHGKTTVTLTWEKGEGASGYKIYYKKSSSSTYTLLDTISGDVTTYRVTGLKSGTTYNFKLRSTCETNEGTTITGRTSSVLTVKTN